MNEKEKIPPEDIPDQATGNSVPARETPMPETESVVSEQPSTLNLSTEAETKEDPKSLNPDMEVHHHTHPGHHKKKWSDYFWEFLMLFLAVFCGFYAEYQLEHKIEKDREKQYVESLLADLESDQKAFSIHSAEVQNGIVMMDSMIQVLNTASQIAGNSSNLYYWARLAPRLKPLPANNRTFDQLKNSGNFRLIRNLESSNKIMAYYEKFPLIRLLESINETEFSDYKRVAAKIFDPAVFFISEGKNDKIIRLNYNPALRSTNPELLQELSIFAVYMHGTKKGVLGTVEELKVAGKDLIAYLRNEYKLD